MTSVSAGHIILTPTQPVGSGRPQRESNAGPPHQESRALPQSYGAPPPPPPSLGGPELAPTHPKIKLSIRKYKDKERAGGQEEDQHNSKNQLIRVQYMWSECTVAILQFLMSNNKIPDFDFGEYQVLLDCTYCRGLRAVHPR